jgi:hypothetical protein
MKTQERHQTPEETTRPLTVRIYLLGAAVLGLTAFFGGGSMLLDPTGASLELPLEWLEGTPFVDYLIPGLVLFGLFGLGSFVVAYGLLRRSTWTAYGAAGLGLALVGWIVTQIALIGLVHALQLVYAGLGLALVGLAVAPSTREYLRP